MSKLLKSMLLLLAITATQTTSALTKTSSALISVVAGAIAGTTVGCLIPEDETISMTNRAYFGNGTFGVGFRRTSDASLPLIGGIGAGLLTAAITYTILYCNFVDEGICHFCGERPNCFSHLFSHEALTNCGHRFNQYCIESYLKKSDDRTCPICRAPIINVFPIIQQPQTVVYV